MPDDKNDVTVNVGGEQAKPQNPGSGGSDQVEDTATHDAPEGSDAPAGEGEEKE